MSTFSTTVTKKQRNARDFDSRGREISICSRQHAKRPGYNPSPFVPQKPRSKPSIANSPSITGLVMTVLKERGMKQKKPTVQVRPNTKRGQRAVAPASIYPLLPELPVETFFETSCELATPRDLFITIHNLSHSKPCIGCAYDEHSKTGCPAKQQLLREQGLIK